MLEVEEALESELVRAREMVIEFEQPGAGTVKGLGFPVKLSRTPGAVRRGGPALGEHTEEVLREGGLRRRARSRRCWSPARSPARARPRPESSFLAS